MSASSSVGKAKQGWMFLLGLLCVEGYGQTRKNMTTLGTYNRPGTQESSAGIWGWTGATGKEYALLTSRDPGGVSIVDISTPATPKLVNFIASTGNSIWHELTSYKNYVYKVSQENRDGLQIINLAPLNENKPAVLVKSPTEFFTVAHTVYVDTTTSPARLYVAYGNTAGVKIFTLEDPENPKLVRTITGETHDMFARGNRLFASNQFKGTITIYDVTDPAGTVPVKLSTIDFANTGSGEKKGIAHNAWLSEDGRYLFTSEETVGCSVKAFDLTGMSLTKAPTLVGKWIAVNTIIAHNVYVKGSLLYVAHYTAGVRVVDISNPAQMKEIAFNRPSTSTDLFGGTWGIYPWFKSGVLIHGDDVKGLFVEKIDVMPVSAKEKAEKARFSISGMNKGILNFQLSQAGPYVVSLFAPSGKELMTLPGSGTAGIQALNLQDGRLSAGHYVAQLRQGSQVLSATVSLGN